MAGRADSSADAAAQRRAQAHEQARTSCDLGRRPSSPAGAQATVDARAARSIQVAPWPAPHAAAPLENSDAAGQPAAAGREHQPPITGVDDLGCRPSQTSWGGAQGSTASTVDAPQGAVAPPSPGHGARKFSACASVASQAVRILPTQAERRVGAGRRENNARTRSGVARARVSARSRLADRAMRRSMREHQEGRDTLAPVLPFVVDNDHVPAACNEHALLLEELSVRPVRVAHTANGVPEGRAAPPRHRGLKKPTSHCGHIRWPHLTTRGPQIPERPRQEERSSR